jgi:tetratricopeptide (TPR) repeat protein
VKHLGISLVLPVLFLLTGATVGADTITVVPGFVQASSPGARSVFEESLATAIASATRASHRHEYRLSTSASNRAPGTTITVTALEAPEERYIVLSSEEGPAAGTSLLLRSAWDGVLPLVLTQALRYFEPAIFGYPAGVGATGSESPLRFVDEFPFESLRPPSPTHGMLGLYPMGLATLPDGNVVVAGSTFAVEVDSLFRVQSFPGVELLDAGNYGYARAVGATPAGTVYLQPAQGTDIYRIIPGAPAPQRIRRAGGGFGPLVVLPDGSVVTIDAVGKRAFRVSGRDRLELPLFSHPDAYISAAAPGPAGNIWTFEAVERRILIHSPEGRMIDSIIPAIPPTAASQTVGLAPYRDGSFLLLTREGLWKVARDGQPEWSLSSLPDGRESGFLQSAAVAVDSEGGFVYIADSQRRNLVRLEDAGVTVSSRAPEHRSLAELAARIAAAGEEPELLAEKARLYAEMGATVLAEATWRYVLDLDPFHREARDGLEEVEFARLLRQADLMAEDARAKLSNLGPASARDSYLQALQLYEQVLAIRPATAEARSRMESLQREFAGSEGGDGRRNPLFLDGVVLDNVFPALFSTYRTRPLGTARVVNRGDVPLEGLRAAVSVRRYSDFPTVTDFPGTIPPGESREIPLRLLLNTNVFEVEEDLPIQALIRVTAGTGTAEYSVESTASLTLHPRTALTWIETERLGAFITPNESNISRFALLATGAGGPEGSGETGGSQPFSRAFSRPFLRAARIVDTVGLYGITYVEDPRTPISAILGRTDVIDTVRLPRTTLLNRAGDCDDTSALLASLLEAAGIATAVVTTPDHVLIAFNTGEPSANAWLYESAGFPVFDYEGAVWLPIETTVFGRGFVATIEAAAKRIQAAGGIEAVGFVATDVARSRYPTIPVPPTQLNLALPGELRIEHQGEATGRRLFESIYTPALASAEALSGAAAGGDPRDPARLSKIGSLHSRFGMTDWAVESFEAALEADPHSPIPRVHYATHLLSRRQPDRAIEVLEPAAERFPESMLIRALLARSYLDAGRFRDAEGHVVLVNDRAPALARRYAIVDREAGARASEGFDAAGALLPDTDSQLLRE